MLLIYTILFIACSQLALLYCMHYQVSDLC